MTAMSRSIPGKAERGGAHRLGNRDRVVEEPVPIGLVVVLGGRSLTEPRPDRGARVEQAVEELSKLRMLDGAEQLAQVGLESFHRNTRSVGEVGPLELLGARGTDCLDRDLPAVLGMDSGAAADVDRGAGDGDLERLLDSIPDHRLDGPGAVADDEPEPLTAVAALAKLALWTPNTASTTCPSARSRTQARSVSPAGSPPLTAPSASGG